MERQSVLAFQEEMNKRDLLKYMDFVGDQDAKNKKTILEYCESKGLPRPQFHIDAGHFLRGLEGQLSKDVFKQAERYKGMPKRARDFVSTLLRRAMVKFPLSSQDSERLAWFTSMLEYFVPHYRGICDDNCPCRSRGVDDHDNAVENEDEEILILEDEGKAQIAKKEEQKDLMEVESDSEHQSSSSSSASFSPSSASSSGSSSSSSSASFSSSSASSSSSPSLSSCCESSSSKRTRLPLSQRRHGRMQFTHFSASSSSSYTSSSVRKKRKKNSTASSASSSSSGSFSSSSSSTSNRSFFVAK
jgi:hypothetical protein